MAKECLRTSYGNTLLELGLKNQNIVVLDADLAKSTKTIMFGHKVGERFLDLGLSEQDMISTAAGIALTGKIVFASSFCVFLAGRVFDQIRQSVCYNDANVKLVGTHAGLGVGEDGATHQALEDIALMRPLPNLKIIAPADATETAQVINYVTSQKGPFYVRLTRNKLEKIYHDDYQFELGQASILKQGQDITIISIGAMVEKAVEAAQILEKQSIEATVINLSTIKPLDKKTIIKYAKETKGIITVEDHSIYGGLGSAVAELLSQHHPTKMSLIGVDNQFGKSGSPDDLYSLYNLTADQIVEKAKAITKQN